MILPLDRFDVSFRARLLLPFGAAASAGAALPRIPLRATVVLAPDVLSLLAVSSRRVKAGLGTGEEPRSGKAAGGPCFSMSPPHARRTT
eukprot:scaffold254006_cov27-Tisochrysis_lutea.AAC.4